VVGLLVADNSFVGSGDGMNSCIRTFSPSSIAIGAMNTRDVLVNGIDGGDFVGGCEGCLDGFVVGTAVGLELGNSVGLLLGILLGRLLGLELDRLLGLELGLLDGWSMGRFVGDLDGFGVGGSDVGEVVKSKRKNNASMFSSGSMVDCSLNTRSVVGS